MFALTFPSRQVIALHIQLTDEEPEGLGIDQPGVLRHRQIPALQFINDPLFGIDGIGMRHDALLSISGQRCRAASIPAWTSRPRSSQKRRKL
jgi:hypothetical protein